nr:hypothetical protein [Pseudomonadota bacterium]
MSSATVENLLELLRVRLDAFAVCEIGDGCALDVAPLDRTVVHYVLQGEGAIESEHGTVPIRSGMVAIIPKR